MRAEGAPAGGEPAGEGEDDLRPASRGREERLRVALGAGRMGVWSWDLATGRQEWDDTTCRLFGLEPGARITRADFIRLVHPEDRPYLDAASARALAQPGTPVECEFRVLVDGEVRWLASRAETLVGPDGRATGRVGVNWDITDRKRAEEALRARDELLDLAERSAGIGVWDHDLATATLRGTPQLFRLLGVEPVEGPLPIDAVRAAFHPEDRGRLGEALARALAEGAERYETECRVVGPGGETRWILVRGRIVRDRNGRAVRCTGVDIDITARKGAEERQHLHAHLLESMTEGVSLSSEDGVIVYTNPALDRMFGYEAGELVGRHVSVQNAYPAEENERIVAEVIARLKAEGVWRGEWRNRRKDGSELVTASRITAVEVGGRRHWLCVQEDVTERRRVERRLAAEHAVAQALAEARDLGEAAPRLLERLCAALEVEAAELWLPEPDGGRIACAAFHAAVPGLERFRQATLDARFDLGTGLPGRVWASGRPAWVERVGEDPNFPRGPAAAADGLVSGFAFPILAEGAVVGVLGLYARRALPRDEGLLEAMTAVGRDIGEFARRTRVEQALRRERELLRSVLDTIPVMITLYNPDTRLLRLNREFERLVGWSTEEALGVSLMERCYPDPAYREEVRAYMDSLAPGWRDIVMTTRDGRRLQTSWANIRLSDDTFVGIGVDITERKRAEERQGLLLAELSHRVKNTLAVVLGIASRTLAGDRTLAEARDALAKRLGALAKTHELLTAAGWRGVSLRALAEAELKPYGKRAAITGDDLTLGPKAAQTLALVLHELATNAAKHGALAAPAGRIEIGWATADGRLRLRWRERDGPPVRPPERQGFGRILLERGVAHDLGGEVTLGFRPDGLVCEVRLSLAQVLAAA